MWSRESSRSCLALGAVVSLSLALSLGLVGCGRGSGSQALPSATPSAVKLAPSAQPPAPDPLVEGARAYEHYCQLCHAKEATGYAAEISMLIDVWREIGADAMAQVDIEERRQPHQPLPALSEMASTILAAVCARLAREGRLDPSAVPHHEIVERPPLARKAKS